MQRLHAGDHAKLSESRNVLGAGILDVLDLVSGIRAAVGFIGSLVGIERKANGPIADGMGEYLESEVVQLHHAFLVFIRIKIELSPVARIVCIRFQHRSCVRLDNTIQQELHRSQINPIIGILFSIFFQNFNNVWRYRGSDKPCHVKAGSQIALLSDLIKQVNTLRIRTGADHAGETQGTGVVDSFRQPIPFFLASRLRNKVLITSGPAASFKKPVGSPVAGLRTIIPFGG